MEKRGKFRKSKLDYAVVMVFVLSIAFVYATQASTTTQGDFNNGTFADVFYNSSGFVQLNISESKSSGNYTSKVFDAGGTNTKWNNISWVASAIGELPSVNQVETAPSGINMTGNVLLFHFNNASAYGESASVVYDFSGARNNGTPIDNAVVNLSNSKLGVGGYEFDGTGDYINMSYTDSLNLNWNYTICAWIYPRDVSAIRTIIKRGVSSTLLKNHQYDLHISTIGALVLWTGDGTSLQTISSTDDLIPVNAWSHVCAKVDETNYRHLFFNGNETGTPAEKTLTWAGVTVIQSIGATTLTGSNPFLGTIDEVAIWNRSLSDTEILNLYKRGITRLNVTVRSCDDINCSGDAWNETYSSSPATLSVSNNSFFQYRANFLTENLSFSPEFYNLTIDFSGSPELPNFTSREILGRPTNNSIVVNLINGNDTIDIYVEYGNESGIYGSYTNTTSISTNVENKSLIELTLTGLEPDARYYYRVRAKRSTAELYGYSDEHNFTTRRSSYPFNFTLVSDSHIGPLNPTYSTPFRKILANASLNDHSDFVLHLGDNVQYSNDPFPDEATAISYYELYRSDLESTHHSIPSFFVVGNHEGENGWHSSSETDIGRNVRKKYIPNPLSNTYAEGGSSAEDYYAFTWGNALFVILNVQSYTTANHAIGCYDAGTCTADDWTLGTTQLAWLNQTLINSNETWKFIFIHHPVGGNLGNWTDPDLTGMATYGRGGGKAAYIGEQATVHQMMLDNHVQVFFYAHDHAFYDLSVDNIHYLMDGESGYGIAEKGRVRVEMLSDELARAYFINESEITKGNVTLDAIAPRILISELTNTTQLNNGNLTINYNVSDASPISDCILIVNGETNQTNYTITKDITLNFTFVDFAPGTYNYTINCTENMTNNFTSNYSGRRGNVGNSSWNVFGVIGAKNLGTGSTNLATVSNLSNISHLTFRQQNYGSINFTDDVDLSSGGNLDLYVNVSFNRIEINATMLPVLNKTAVLTIYNLTFIDPRILRNGEVCPSSICAEINYTGGNLTFNVTSFSIYTTEETPEEEATDEEIRRVADSTLPVYKVSKEKLEQGYERLLGEGFKLIFDIGEEHTLTVEDISVNRVRITVESNPITFDLNVNGTRKLDLNKDGFYDFEIFLKEIRGSMANFVFKKIREKVVSNEPVQENRSETTADNEAGGGETVSANKTTIKVIIASLVLVILLVIIIILVVKRRRHQRKWGYKC